MSRTGWVKWALRWGLGSWLLIQSLVLALSPRAAEAFARTGLDDRLRLGLAWSEAVAALLWMLPRTSFVGGLALLAILGAAWGLHRGLGFGGTSLAAYALVVWALLTFPSRDVLRSYPRSARKHP